MDFRKLALGAVLAVALVGCGGGKPESASPAATLPSGSATAPLSGTVKLQIDDFKTSPQNLFVKKGSLLEVINNDVAGHSLTADDGSFDTGVLGKGKSATVTLDTVGTFKFHCTPHPSTAGLQGTITVVE